MIFFQLNTLHILTYFVVSTDELETSYYNNEGFRCVNWSQTGLAKTQSCFLAVVTTKHRVLLYQSAVRDPINSDWQLVR